MGRCLLQICENEMWRSVVWQPNTEVKLEGTMLQCGLRWSDRATKTADSGTQMSSRKYWMCGVTMAKEDSTWNSRVELAGKHDI